MIYKSFDVVVVPFPFTDQNTNKRRPALILSDYEIFNYVTQNCVMAMITSAKNPEWPLDVNIGSIKKAGLPAPSKVRMKLFTLDSRLIVKKIGGLAAKDREAVKKSLTELMDIGTKQSKDYQ